jgi:hypothetical protein
MYLLNEELVRLHTQDRLAEAEQRRRMVRVARAARLQRRADKAVRRARHAIALAS